MKNVASGLMVCGLTLMLTMTTGCPALFGNNNQNDPNSSSNEPNDANEPNMGGGGSTSLSFVKTNISVRHDAGLRCGDDVIAFGTGATNGVAWIRPSANDTVARTIANSDDYNSSAFDVAKDKIYMAGGPDDTFQMTVYDTTNDTTTSFPTTDIRLRNLPIDQSDPGNPQADGNYCVVICDENTVSDEKMIKVIDCSGSTPTVWGFDTNPASFNSAIDQVAIDATSMKVVAVVGNDIYVYNLADKNAAPAQYTVGDGFDLNEAQAKLSGDYLICRAGQSTGSPMVKLVDITDGTSNTIELSESALGVAIGGMTYGFFADNSADDSLGSDYRAATGTVPNTSNTKAPIEQYIDGSTTNNGAVGFGQTMWITPNGDYAFLAGSEGLGSGEFLQWSTGSGWAVAADTDASSPYGLPATDVHCSNGLVGFKSGNGTTAGTSTVLGYAVLP